MLIQSTETFPLGTRHVLSYWYVLHRFIATGTWYHHINPPWIVVDADHTTIEGWPHHVIPEIGKGRRSCGYSKHTIWSNKHTPHLSYWGSNIYHCYIPGIAVVPRTLRIKNKKIRYDVKLWPIAGLLACDFYLILRFVPDFGHKGWFVNFSLRSSVLLVCMLFCGGTAVWWDMQGGRNTDDEVSVPLSRIVPGNLYFFRMRGDEIFIWVSIIRMYLVLLLGYVVCTQRMFGMRTYSVTILTCLHSKRY